MVDVYRLHDISPSSSSFCSSLGKYFERKRQRKEEEHNAREMNPIYIYIYIYLKDSHILQLTKSCCLISSHLSNSSCFGHFCPIAH